VKKASKHISEQYSWFRKALAMIASNAQVSSTAGSEMIREEGLKSYI
jgi:hypothetical protein